MNKPATDLWLDWGRRFRIHCREHGIRMAALAETLGRTEAGLRHWTNGTREINLSEFFKLCKAASADPSAILFGRLLMSEEQRKHLGELALSILESDPSSSDGYNKMSLKMKKVKKAGVGGR